MHDDGEAVAFRIERVDGEILDVSCSLPEIGDIFNFLGSLAKDAGELRATQPQKPTEGYNYITAIPAQGIGFQPGPGPDETMIVIRLTGFDMAFAVPNNALARLADDISRIARTLSAQQDKH